MTSLGEADVAPLHLDALLDLDAVDFVCNPALQQKLLVVNTQQCVSVNPFIQHFVRIY